MMRNYLYSIISFCLFFGCINISKADYENIANKEVLERKKIEFLKKRSRSNEEIERVAKEYESVAINKMLQQMHEGQKPDPIFGGGSSEKIYKEMLLTEYGKIISDQGGIGIRESIVRDMKKINNQQMD